MTGIELSAPAAPIRGLVVNSFTSAGIFVGSSSTIVGSYIGTGLTGSTDLGNGNAGILLNGSNSTVGGVAAGAGDLISGNGFTGINISGDSNTVAGNVIGLDAAGTTAIANCFGGIRVGGASNLIGGLVSGARNVISGNQGCAVSRLGRSTVYQSLAATRSRGT